MTSLVTLYMHRMMETTRFSWQLDGTISSFIDLFLTDLAVVPVVHDAKRNAFLYVLGKHMNKTWEASGLTSPDGETVELASNLVVDGAVEMWLAALEGAMQTALQKLLASSLQAYKGVRAETYLWSIR